MKVMKTVAITIVATSAFAALAGCVAVPADNPRPQQPRYERGPGGDRDHDGIPNRYDRDRDGDGVPNRYDRSPNNPRRN